MTVYKPSLDSFCGSFFFGLTPALTAGLALYFVHESAGWLFWIPTGLMFLLSLFLSVQCVVVYLNRLQLDEERIRATGPLHSVEIRWSQVTGAVLRERVNPMTRTDHMLVIKSRGATLVFNTSTLSLADEAEVLRRVRDKINVTVQRDRPAI